MVDFLAAALEQNRLERVLQHWQQPRSQLDSRLCLSFFYRLDLSLFFLLLLLDFCLLLFNQITFERCII
ncbi:hypothetical protein MRX58_12495 (plasmid) [Xylella fastidiosa subsp. pauca]|nr:hypothetical protein [Xylella fastidiosa subsp. pauca]